MLGQFGSAKVSRYSGQIENSLYGLHVTPSLPEQCRIFSSSRYDPHSGSGGGGSYRIFLVNIQQ